MPESIIGPLFRHGFWVWSGRGFDCFGSEPSEECFPGL